MAVVGPRGFGGGAPPTLLGMKIVRDDGHRDHHVAELDGGEIIPSWEHPGRADIVDEYADLDISLLRFDERLGGKLECLESLEGMGQ